MLRSDLRKFNLEKTNLIKFIFVDKVTTNSYLLIIFLYYAY